MPPVFFDSMKIFMFESNNRRRMHQTDGIKKVVKTYVFVQGWRIGLKFPQEAMIYRSNLKFCDCSVKMYLLFVVFAYQFVDLLVQIREWTFLPHMVNLFLAI